MILNETLLMAWVDGELSSHEAAEVADLVARSPEAQAQAAAMAVSQLPYREAFEHQHQPEIPARLAASIAVLTEASRDRATPMPPLGGRQPSRWQGVWIAMAFVAGVGCTLGGMRFWESTEEAESPWITAVTQYQEMYVRDTLVQVHDNAALSARTLADIQTQDRMPIVIPDLQSANLEFKRVQRLRYGDKPVVQMVYMPASGDPIALCAAPDIRPDKAMQQRMDENLSVVTWRSGNISYMLVGRSTPATLRDISERIRSGKVPALYS